MCKTPADIDEKLLVETLQEYARRKGLFVSQKEAKIIASDFKKKYNRFPNFKEIWTLADKAVLQKSEGEKVSLETKVEKKMAEIEKTKEVKKERKKAVEEKRKGVAKVEKVEDVEEKEIKEETKCSECGHVNPADSRFCLECGNKLK